MNLSDPMTNKLLLIAIPTYNRSSYLERLLECLRNEIAGFEGLVSIVVSDNGSTDGTSTLLKQWENLIPSMSIIAHPQNYGMDANFIACATSCICKYLWLLGDDDIPRPGALKVILEILQSEAPDLLYLNSCSIAHRADYGRLSKCSDVEYSRMSRAGFAKRVNVWLTYLSGNIVKASEVLHDSVALARHEGSHLSQLVWTLERLKNGTRFVFVGTPIVFSQPANTGGYSVLNVFLRQFPAIMNRELEGAGSKGLVSAVMIRTLLGYYPGLVLSARLSLLGCFSPEKLSEILAFRALSDLPSIIVLTVVAKAPLQLSRVVVKCTSLAARILSRWDRFVESRRSDMFLPAT